MGKPIALATLRSDIRFDFDIDASSFRISDAQLDRVINRSRDALFLYLLDCNAHYMDAFQVLTTVEGIGYVSLPARFYALTALRLRCDDGTTVPLRAATVDEIKADPVTARSWTEHRPVYWIAQNLLCFWPLPAGAYTLECVYVQGFEDMSDAGDPWYVQPGWDEWVVLRSLMKLWRRQKNMEAFQAVAAELGGVSAQIESALSGQDRATPTRARRLHGDGALASRLRLPSYAEED